VIRLARLSLVLLIAVGVLGWWLTAPETSDSDLLAGVTPDAVHGRNVFNTAGCASYHQTEAVKDRLELGGGQAFPSDFGTFFAPNISPDPEHGIGRWQPIDLVNAMRHGTSPDGSHYYPAFPYTSYGNATLFDIASLYTYLMTLPAVSTPNAAHEVGFPFNVRRLLGGWKLLFGRVDWALRDAPDPETKRGRYLVEALGHCGECHTPRNVLGGLDRARWLSGAPNPTGKGRIPNITAAKLNWSDADLMTYFKTGLTPDFDSAGGHMAAVIRNLEQLPEEDLRAIIAYLRAVPSVE
jgi:mono/diheme cytochrome c family protein